MYKTTKKQNKHYTKLIVLSPYENLSGLWYVYVTFPLNYLLCVYVNT